jgi:hypothetical protein
LVVNPTELATIEAKPGSLAISMSYKTPPPVEADHVKLLGNNTPVDASIGLVNETALGVGSEMIKVTSSVLIPEVLLPSMVMVKFPVEALPVFEMVKVELFPGTTGFVEKVAVAPAGYQVAVNVTGSL